MNIRRTPNPEVPIDRDTYAHRERGGGVLVINEPVGVWLQNAECHPPRECSVVRMSPVEAIDT